MNLTECAEVYFSLSVKADDARWSAYLRVQGEAVLTLPVAGLPARVLPAGRVPFSGATNG